MYGDGEQTLGSGASERHTPTPTPSWPDCTSSHTNTEEWTRVTMAAAAAGIGHQTGVYPKWPTQPTKGACQRIRGPPSTTKPIPLRTVPARLDGAHLEFQWLGKADETLIPAVSSFWAPTCTYIVLPSHSNCETLCR